MLQNKPFACSTTHTELTDGVLLHEIIWLNCSCQWWLLCLRCVFISSQMNSLAFNFERGTTANTSHSAPEATCFQQHGNHGRQHLHHLGQSQLAVGPRLRGHLLQRHVWSKLEQHPDGLQTQEFHAWRTHPRQSHERTPRQPPPPNGVFPVCDVSGSQPSAGPVPSVQHPERKQRRSRQSRLGARNGRLADLLHLAPGHCWYPVVGMSPYHLLHSQPGSRWLPCGH